MMNERTLKKLKSSIMMIDIIHIYLSNSTADKVWSFQS